jgi:glycosyltransferase involved in cell wall biosynthesis
MKILCITPYYKPAYVYGGPTRSNSQLCEALVKLGAEVTVLTTNANGSEVLDVPLGVSTMVDGVEVFYYPVLPLFSHSYFYSPSLGRACHQKAKQYDIAFLDTIFSHAMGPGVAACKQAGVPYIITLRSALLPWGLRHGRLKKKLYLFFVGDTYFNHAAALHCTDPVEAVAVENLGMRAPCFVVPNGIDTRPYSCLPLRGAMRQHLGIPERANVLLFLGRIHVKKRPDLAIEALAAAQSLPGETHLVLAGPDEMQLIPKLQIQARALGCLDRLHITGLLRGDELLSALADSDLFLMPSEPESENFGMSALEAMAAGLPVLVSEGVPIGSWAEAAGAGRIVPCSADAFTKTTCELLARPEELKAMGLNGRILAREKFDIFSVAQHMFQQYQAIISTGRPFQSSADISNTINSGIMPVTVK